MTVEQCEEIAQLTLENALTDIADAGLYESDCPVSDKAVNFIRQAIKELVKDQMMWAMMEVGWSMAEK